MAFDPKKPVQTRDGLKARIICTDRVGSNSHSIVALVGNDQSVYTYTPNGKWAGSITEFCPNDLVNIPERTSTWQLVSANNNWLFGEFKSTEESLSHRPAASKPVGHIRRDFEDGVFVGAEFEPYVSEKEGENN